VYDHAQEEGIEISQPLSGENHASHVEPISARATKLEMNSPQKIDENNDERSNSDVSEKVLEEGLVEGE
jgi:hypothetical protein